MNVLFEQIKQKLIQQGKTVEERKSKGITVLRTNCIFHPDDTPSLDIFENGGYHCFGCGRSGSMQEIAEMLKVGTVKYTRNERVKKKGIEYIKMRFAFTKDEQAINLMHEFNIKPYMYGRKEGILIDLFNGSWTFRAFDGKVYMNENVSRPEFPAFFSLINRIQTKTIIITEGVFDALTVNYELKALEVAYNTTLQFLAICTQGALYTESDVFSCLEKQGIGEVILAFDNDEQGKKYTERFMNEGLSRGFIVNIIQIPDGYKDLNELYVRNRELYYKTIAEPLSVFEYYLKNCSLNTIEDRRLAYRKLVSFYEQSTEKTVSRKQIIDALQKYNLDISEWMEEFEKRDLYRLHEEKKNELTRDLKQLAVKLEKSEIDIDDAIGYLASKDYKTVKIEKLSDISDEILSDDDLKNSFYFRFLTPNVRFFLGDLVLLSACTKAGKTTMAINMCKALLKDKKSKVIYFTYELTRRQLFRLFAQSFYHKTIEEINETDKAKLIDELDGRLFIYSNSTVQEICAYVNAIKPDFFVIDYDESVPIQGKFESRERELAHLTLALKQCAVNNNSVCLMLSQVNDDKEVRYSKSKEHYASVHLYLEKITNQLVTGFEEVKCTVKLNRYGRSGDEIILKVNFQTRTLQTFVEVVRGDVK